MKNKKSKILIVSDDLSSGKMRSVDLQQHGYETTLAPCTEKAEQMFAQVLPDVIVVDVTTDHQSAIEFVRKLRSYAIVPILFMTSTNNESQTLEVYAAGVDECATKPVSLALFLAKIRVCLRHSWNISTDVLDPLQVGEVKLLPADRTVILNNSKSIQLTNLELSLLYTLLSRAGRTFTAEELCTRIWGYNSDVDLSTLKNLVYRLRQKIEADSANPAYIRTISGMGYQFCVQATPVSSTTRWLRAIKTSLLPRLTHL